MSRDAECRVSLGKLLGPALMLVLMSVATTVGAQQQQQQQQQQQVGGKREFGFNLRDDAAELTLSTPATGTFDASQAVERRFGFFFNADNDLAASAGLHASGGPTQGFNPMSLGAGAKLYGFYAEEIDRSAAALAISGSLNFSIAGQIPQNFIIEGNIAPNITSFGRAERLFEWKMRYRLDVTPQSAVYVGYRYLKADFAGGDSVTMDSNMHIGMQIAY